MIGNDMNIKPGDLVRVNVHPFAQLTGKVGVVHGGDAVVVDRSTDLPSPGGWARLLLLPGSLGARR